MSLVVIRGLVGVLWVFQVSARRDKIRADSFESETRRNGWRWSDEKHGEADRNVVHISF